MITSRGKALLKQFASPVLDRLGLFDRQLSRTLTASSWTIVMYHRVIDDASADPFSLGMCVTRRHFEDQLTYFRDHFQVIGMADAMRQVHAGERLPDRALSITFDDGYLDNLTVALPVIRTLGLPVTLFVPTGGMEDDTPLWWDRVIHTLDATELEEIVPAAVGIPLPDRRLSLGAWQRRDTVERVLDALWTLRYDEALQVVERMAQLYPARRKVAPVARRMTGAQVVEMHRAGIEIGAHSVRHPNLTLETPETVRQEMRESRLRLEALCEAPIHGFAYPAGWKNEDAEAAAREVGFDYALATTRGVNHRDHLDLFALARVGMPDTGVSDLKRALVTVGQIIRPGGGGR